MKHVTNYQHNGVQMCEIKIQTKRLVIRDLDIADAEPVFKYRSDDAISRYQTFAPKSLDEVIQFIEENTNSFNIQGNWYQVGIYRNNQIIGDAGIHFIGSENKQCEIGYTIRKKYQRQGILKGRRIK